MSQSLPTSPALCDVPLSVDEPADTTPDPQKTHNSKTNSLKRFFKLNKRHSGGEEMASASGTHEMLAASANIEDNDVAKGSDTSGGSGSPSGKNDKLKSTKRFHLRLGGMSRIVEQANSGSFMSSSASRQTLKSSISSYWNTMFGRGGKKTAQSEDKSNADDDDDDDDDDDAEEEALETEIREEVHTLPISEDNADVEGAQAKSKN